MSVITDVSVLPDWMMVVGKVTRATVVVDRATVRVENTETVALPGMVVVVGVDTWTRVVSASVVS